MTTELVFIIDRSGSMEGLERDTVGGFNSMLEQQKKVEGEAYVTTVLFDDKYEILHDRVNIKNVAPMTVDDYTVRGSTALFDAIGRTIHNIRKAQKTSGRDGKAMFFIITDGQENASHRYTAEMIRERIEHYRKDHGWEFVFFGANMDAVYEASLIGIPANSASNYSSDSIGTHSAYSTMSAVSTAFRTNKHIPSQVSEEPQDIGGAFGHLKAMLNGLRDSAQKMQEDFRELIDAANANGGKIPDVNELLRQALNEDDKEEKE